MANYIINKPGSTDYSYPSSLSNGDTLRFNVTNIDEKTRYSGTMITYTFPVECKVRIEAYGARGGFGNKGTLDNTGKGAKKSGIFTFKEGDTLLICVGQKATDFVGSLSDGVSGAGGGGTFVTLKNDSASDIYQGAGIGNGWKIEPLIIAAGGNGSQDVGYSGTGNIYHGKQIEGTMPTYGAYSGGGYLISSSSTNAGKHFLSGCSGATVNYTRSSTSIAGFGGGGGNADDAGGGGGGGYYGGTRGSASAYSFASKKALDVQGADGVNEDDGYLIIEFIEVPGARVSINVENKWTVSKEVHVKVDNEWKKAKKLYIKVDGTWKESK